MKSLLKKNRFRVNQELRIDQRQYFSPATYGLNRTIVPVIRKFAKGKLLDIGCGDMPYKDMITPLVDQYETLDIEERARGVTHMGSIERMDMITDQFYDSVVCFEVLEHVANPFRGIKEVQRILKKGGILMLSVPHLSRLHEEPNDYFRYTKYGIESLLRECGFEILEVKPTGAVFSFLGHQISTVIVCLFWHIPFIKWSIFFINKWLGVFPVYLLDRLILKNSLFPLGYVCVAQKK